MRKHVIQSRCSSDCCHTLDKILLCIIRKFSVGVSVYSWVSPPPPPPPSPLYSSVHFQTTQIHLHKIFNNLQTHNQYNMIQNISVIYLYNLQPNNSHIRCDNNKTSSWIQIGNAHKLKISNALHSLCTMQTIKSAKSLSIITVFMLRRAHWFCLMTKQCHFASI